MRQRDHDRVIDELSQKFLIGPLSFAEIPAGDVQMTSVRPASIIATMVVSFSLAFGVMLWQRKREALRLPIPETISTAPAIAPATAHAVARPQPAVAEKRESSTVGTGTGAPNQDVAAEMPVRLFFRRRERLDKLVGRVFNSSSDPMAIDVYVISAGSRRTSQTALDVAANGQAIFGADDGLDLQSGDEVTLRSPLYRDLVTRVP